MVNWIRTWDKFLHLITSNFDEHTFIGLLWGSRRHADTAILLSTSRRCSSTETPPTRRLFRNLNNEKSTKRLGMSHSVKQTYPYLSKRILRILRIHLLCVRICISTFSSPVNSQAIGHSNLWRKEVIIWWHFQLGHWAVAEFCWAF